MIKEKYLIAENPPSMQGPGLVLSTKYPFWIGKVVQFKTIEEQEDFFSKLTDKENNLFFRCNGYRIGVLIIEPLSRDIGKVFSIDAETASGMAQYFLENKILKNASYYKRYKD